jgi:hypothetical protein
MAKDKVYDIDVKLPHETLVDLIGFQTKPGNRIKTYLETYDLLELSLRDLMDLFLPPASDVYISEDDFWLSIPILRQPQFGPYLYDSALLSLTEAELGDVFRSEWMLRIYSLKLHELKHCPANKRLYQSAR